MRPEDIRTDPDVMSAWTGVLDAVRRYDAAVAKAFEAPRPVQLHGHALTRLGFPHHAAPPTLPVPAHLQPVAGTVGTLPQGHFRGERRAAPLTAPVP